MLRTRAGLSFDGAAMSPEAYQDMLTRITVPTTLVYGDGSRAGSEAARDAGVIAPTRARRIVLLGGHNLHFETPEALAAVIAECSLTS
jgi:pimeloyl-ACP methyl ester carboxylesterase